VNYIPTQPMNFPETGFAEAKLSPRRHDPSLLILAFPRATVVVCRETDGYTPDDPRGLVPMIALLLWSP